MKNILLLILLLFNLASFSQSTDTISVDGTSLLYHFAKSENKGEKSLIIFLHGSLSQFKDQKKPLYQSKDELCEGNLNFESNFLKSNFDLVFPLAFNEYNWFTEKGEKYILELIEKLQGDYKSIYISGFSDGGTGAYRIFYKNSEKFAGLIAFNAYPQMDYFNKKVDYKKIVDKKVIYFSQSNDNLINYEFSLMEYRRQKMVNENTYFFIREGKHQFIKYSSEDFAKCLELLNQSFEVRANNGDLTWVYPPLDGLMIFGKLLETYDFRQKVGKKYGMNAKESMSQIETKKLLDKILKSGDAINFAPILISNKDLQSKELLDFTFISGTNKYTMAFENYFLIENW